MRQFFALTILTIFLLLECANNSEQPEWKRKYKSNAVCSMFANPPMFYAPHTFWFWDDTIKDEHFAVSMVDKIARQRINPGYVHPRGSRSHQPNVIYPSLPFEQYLGKLWFDSFGNALQNTKNYGLTLGYCDEYEWPSGQCAGRVLKLHPELEAQYLDWKRYELCENSTVQLDSVDFAIAGKMIDKKLDASTLQLIGEGNNLNWKSLKGDWIVYAYTKKYHAGIDGGKVNCLDPKLMDTFIPMVYGQYEKHFKDDLGRSIPGVFVDNEGDFGWQMAWSEYLAKRYREIKKRDIRLWLPLLTEKDKDGLFAKARYDWFDVVSEVYKECFFKPVVTWLNHRNMYYISNLWEESLFQQVKAVGDFMRITRTATMPGNDCLQMTSQKVHDFKETQSIAEFEDRPFMSEIMGATGWEQTPEMMKMTINSITSFGVNHVVLHGINTNRQIETIPFPADWFTENPYWPYLHYWSDFARRAAFVTRQSKLVADVLLFNPTESIWAFTEDYFSNGRTKKWEERSVETDKIYSEAMEKLNENNIDFLIADKYYLNKATLTTKDGPVKINIKNHEFLALVLPPLSILSHATSAKIFEFAKKGGLVIILGEMPQGSPEKGMKDEIIIAQMKALKKLSNVIDLSKEKNRLDNLATILNSKINPQIRLKNSGRLYTAHRKMPGNDFYWLANNTDTLKNLTAWFRDGNGSAEIWNCETGKIEPVTSTLDSGINKISLTLHPYEGYWLVFNNKKVNIQKESIHSHTTNNEVILDKKWTLIYPQTDTLFKTTAKVLYSSDEIADTKTMEPGYMDSTWKYFERENLIEKDPEKEKEKTKNFIYWRTRIPIGTKSIIFPSDMLKMDIWIDGKKICLSDTVLNLTTSVDLLSYILPVKNQKSLLTSPLKFVVQKKENCSLESWYKYGLQQYTGYIDYETNFKIDKISSTISIDLGKVKYMAEVFVNDKSVGARLWPPFVFDISKEIKQGENKIRIRVGNLMVGNMWVKWDMGNLRTWGFNGIPDFNKFDAGLLGPVKLLSSDNLTNLSQSF